MTDVLPSRTNAPPVERASELAGTSTELSNVPKWLSLAIVVVTASYMAVRYAGPLTNPDTWWHLRLGEEFRHGWSLSDPGQLSPFATRSWFATEWLFEVVASYLTDAFGLAGVAWLTGVAVLVLAGALFAACRQEGNALAASVAVMMALGGLTATIAARPQLASFILLAVVTAAWLRTSRDLRPRWWLIPLTFVWACAHGMWVAGVLTGLAVIVGLLLDRRLSSRQALRLLLVPVLGVCAAALTPVGPKLLLAPVTISGVAPIISEWQPPNFRQPFALLTAMMLMLIVVTWSRGARTSWSHVLLLVIAFGWTALSIRTIALGAVMAAPLLSAAIHQWTSSRPVGSVPRRERLAVAGGLTMGLLLLTVLAPIRAAPSPPLTSNVETALTELPVGTVVFNDNGLGGWLEWAHRNTSPVTDGLADAYQPAFLTQYVNALQVGPHWEAFLARTGARYALLNPSTPLAVDLQAHLGWRAVASSPSAVLLKQQGP